MVRRDVSYRAQDGNKAYAVLTQGSSFEGRSTREGSLCVGSGIAGLGSPGARNAAEATRSLRVAGHKPPLTKRGVERPEVQSTGLTAGESDPLESIPDPAVALVDWLKVTFHQVDPADVLAAFSGEGLEWASGMANRHYAVCLRRGNVSVFWQGRTPGTEDTVHVDVSGDGCRQLEREQVVTDWPVFLGWLIAAGGRIRRLDVALDDRRGLVTSERVHQAIVSGAFSSRYEREKVRQEFSGSDGYCAYFGTRQGECMVRLYDKNAERHVSAGVGPVRPWFRCELELKDTQAHQVAIRIAASGDLFGLFVGGLLLGKLRFTEGDDPRARRRPTAWWWSAFLGEVEKVRLGCYPSVSTIARQVAWVTRQWLPTLGLLSLADGVGIRQILDWVKEGRRRLRGQHVSQLLAHNGKRLVMEGVAGVFGDGRYWWGRSVGAVLPQMRLSAAVAFGGYG